MSADPRWMQRLEAVYGMALRLYPRSFRRRWEQPMRQAFRDRCREVARGQARPATLLRELLPDLAFGVGREHFIAFNEGAMFKRNLLLAALVLFGATVLMRDRVATMGLAAGEWWQVKNDAWDAAADARYWGDLARALEPADAPREHALAALAWQQRASAQPASAADAAERAQRHWDVAIAAGDPAALWLSATDCPVHACDSLVAITALQRQEPDNAAVQLLAFAHATRAGDAPARSAALARMAQSHRYHGYGADLLKSLLEADNLARPGWRLRWQAGSGQAAADAKVAGVAMAWANPRVDAFLDYCRPQSGDAVRDSDCQTAARVVASGNSLVARLSGYRVWNRYADGGPDAATVRQGLRDLAWMMRHAYEAPGAAAAARWRTAWLDSDGEVAAYRRLMAARGIEVRAPAGFAIDASLLDPSR